MSTLDNPNVGLDESSVPWFPVSQKWGLIGGGIFIAYTLLSIVLGFDVPSSIMGGLMVMVLIFGIAIAIIVLAIRQHRNEDLKGYISFGRAFLVGLVSMVIAGVLSTVFTLIYTQLIDTGYAESVIDRMTDMFENMEAPQEVIDEQLAAAEERFTTTGLLKQGLLWGPIIYAVFSAIVALIMKKKAPLS